MTNHTPSMIRSVAKFALLAVLLAVPSTLVQAQEKAQKYRGNVISIDLKAKSLTISTPKGSQKVVMWDGNTKIQSPFVTDYSDIKPGMYFRCIMVDRTDMVGRLRHEVEFDKVDEEAPAPVAPAAP